MQNTFIPFVFLIFFNEWPIGKLRLDFLHYVLRNTPECNMMLMLLSLHINFEGFLTFPNTDDQDKRQQIQIKHNICTFSKSSN